MKSVLVGLDLTEMDAYLIKYASLICESYNIEDVHFIHIAKNLELPNEIIKKYSDVFVSVDEGIEHSIQEIIDDNFKASSHIHISVQEGSGVDKILRYAKIKNVDLIILGNKKHLKGSGVIPESIARKSPCHLLLVPENTEVTKISKIIVPVDFSEHSHLALEHALELAENFNAEVSCVHIYEVHSGYSKIGKSYEEFAEIMLGHARKDFNKFISKYKQSLDCDFILSKDHEFSDELNIYFQATKPDIVFIGSKGRTNAAVVFLGSMAEKLSKNIDKAPLFIVKRKGESINIFEALLRL